MTIAFGSHTAKTTADKDGHWRATLDPLPASADPAEFHVTGTASKLDFTDVALAARHLVYGEDIVYSGPTYAGIEVAGAEARVSFNHRGGGLVIGASPMADPQGVLPKPLDHPEGFELAGADGKFVPASAKIDGDVVAVTAPGVAAPTAVRYGRAGYMLVNLYDREALPAVPFSSQSTPVVP